ncbi:MAG: hypothetical protein IKB04_09425, partial [Clostridia bacterium]|nr:hypothetical protein [Clostridia bacterium]
MHKENEKTTLWREQIVQENMKKQLIGGGMIGMAALILSGFVALLTWGLCSSMAGEGPFVIVWSIVMLVFLWGIVILLLIGAGACSVM